MDANPQEIDEENIKILEIIKKYETKNVFFPLRYFTILQKYNIPVVKKTRSVGTQYDIVDTEEDFEII